MFSQDTTPDPALAPTQVEMTKEGEGNGSGDAEPKQEIEKDNKFPEILDDGKVWYYGRHTPSGINFKRIVEVNPKNRHETLLMELGEDIILGKMVYCQGKLRLVL